jgi:hypothetical protein
VRPPGAAAGAEAEERAQKQGKQVGRGARPAGFGTQHPEDAYHAFGLIGTSLSKKISVFQSSSVEVAPISPAASQGVRRCAPWPSAGARQVLDIVDRLSDSLTTTVVAGEPEVSLVTESFGMHVQKDSAAGFEGRTLGDGKVQVRGA